MSVDREALKELAERWLVPSHVPEPPMAETRLAQGALSLLAELEAVEVERDQLQDAIEQRDEGAMERARAFTAHRKFLRGVEAERDQLRAEVERLRGERYEPTKAKLDACTEVGERLQAKNQRLREALEEIVQWSEAYPLRVFPEPDFARAAVVLRGAGMTLDAISASNMRHAITGAAAIARRALGEDPDHAR